MTPMETEKLLTQLVQRALDGYRLGRAAEVSNICQHILALQPQHVDALHLLGLVQRISGDQNRALQFIARAITVDGRAARLPNSLGNVLKDGGRWRDASANYRRALVLAPDLPEFHFNFAAAQARDDMPGQAEQGFRRTLAILPDHPAAQDYLALALQQQRRLEAADILFKRQLNLRPDHGQACLARGQIAAQGKDYPSAAMFFRRHLRLGDATPQAVGELARVLQTSKDEHAAGACYRWALALQPDDAEIWNNFGAMIEESPSTVERSSRLFLRAQRIYPEFVESLHNLARALKESERLDAARLTYLRVSALRPDFWDLQFNLGIVQQDDGLLQQACLCYERALLIEPENRDAFRPYLSCITYRDDLSIEALKDIHQRFGRSAGLALAPHQTRRHATGRDGRLKIGYLSSDLRDHPVAYALLAVVRRHDRSAFSLHFYADVAKPERATFAFQALADGWCNTSGLSDAAVADRIREDGIDILVCLAGRFDKNRPEFAAYRSAPVQISLHDVATSGLAEMDYIIGDRWLLPPSNEEYFAERCLRLPQFYFSELPDGLPDIEEAVADTPAVFGCFNNPSKITSTTLRLWGAILRAQPASRLVLKYLDRYGSQTLRTRILNGLCEAGAEAGQVEFIAGSQEAKGVFLSRYNVIDVALDTMPFSGSTTSFQALAMGVPVVTWPWDRMVSRWSAAILHGIGLTDLITTSADAYVAKAVAVAEGRQTWRLRRREIRQRLLSSALQDPEGWTRHLERLYKAVWRRYSARQGHQGGLPAQGTERSAPA